mmetsp:Transcript_10087/g.39299  ORF Transcript_10087/g.39299 Transcript_10087/m.39299 type:complete len:242 (+) Transcript_10087:687-1412(+)
MLRPCGPDRRNDDLVLIAPLDLPMEATEGGRRNERLLPARRGAPSAPRPPGPDGSPHAATPGAPVPSVTVIPSRLPRSFSDSSDGSPGTDGRACSAPMLRVRDRLDSSPKAAPSAGPSPSSPLPSALSLASISSRNRALITGGRRCGASVFLRLATTDGMHDRASQLMGGSPAAMPPAWPSQPPPAVPSAPASTPATCAALARCSDATDEARLPTGASSLGPAASTRPSPPAIEASSSSGS